jgi:hypothetical protein
VAARAVDRGRKLGRSVRGVRPALGPRIIAGAMASRAVTASVAEVHAPIDVARDIEERAAGLVRVAVTARARPARMIGGRARVTVAAVERASVGPRRRRLRTAAVVASDGAATAAGIEARARPRPGGVERDVDATVGVEAGEKVGRGRRRVTRRTVET